MTSEQYSQKAYALNAIASAYESLTRYPHRFDADTKSNLESLANCVDVIARELAYNNPEKPTTTNKPTTADEEIPF